MAGLTPSGRTEMRVPMSVLVELYSFDNASYEITNTIDVSQHGARVLSKMPWAANQRVSLRALHGDLNSQARIVYCERLSEKSYAVGLQLHQTTDAWLPPTKSFKATNGR